MQSTVYNAMYSTGDFQSGWHMWTGDGFIEEQQNWLPVHLSRPLVKDLLDRQAPPLRFL